MAVGDHCCRTSLLATGAKPAKAQVPEAAPEEITVTGTRIRRTDGMAEPVPVTTLSPAELQLFEPGSTVAEQLDALPQFFATSTAQRGGPALFGNGGGSYLNMRGLGPERTLVLFDGFRMPPADKRGSVNVDTLPTALVRSVDVVTGGATAAYGADALGGVTNFVLDREFQGLKFNAGTGMNEFNNEGKTWNMSVAGGIEIGERLNIIGSFEARQIDQIVRNPAELDPSWFQRWGHVQNPAWSAADPPGTNPRRLTVPWVAPAGLHVNGKIAGVPATSALNNMRFNDTGTAIVPFNHGHRLRRSWISGGPDAQMSHLTQPGGPNGSEVDAEHGILEPEVHRIRLHRRLLRRARRAHRVEQPAVHQRRIDVGPWSPTVFRENAYFPEPSARSWSREPPASARERRQLPRRARRLQHERIAQRVRYVDVPRRLRVDHDRPMGHARGVQTRRDGEDDRDLRRAARRPDGARRGRRRDLLGPPRRERRPEPPGSRRRRRPRHRPDRLQRAALQPDAGGSSPPCPRSKARRRPRSTASCRSLSPIGLDNTISECVPFNIMGHGQITPAAADYITTPKWGDSVVEQDFAELLVRGELTDGWGAGALSLATGLTYREQSFHDGVYPVEIDELGPPFNAINLGIRGIPLDVLHGQPEPAPVLHGVGDLGRLRRLGGVRRGQRADLAMGIRGNASA